MLPCVFYGLGCQISSWKIFLKFVQPFRLRCVNDPANLSIGRFMKRSASVDTVFRGFIMRFYALSTLCSAVLLATSIPASAEPHVRRGPTAPRVAKSHAKAVASKPVLAHISMSSQRATEIQSALIKAGYLSGTPSGTWDASSQTAMEKLQADNGWQTKIVPDSRAIIKLGLGPAASPVSEPVASVPGETPAIHPANR